MEKCLYEPVSSKDVVILKNEKKYKNYSWKPLIRQVLVCSGVWNAFFTTGLCYGAPTVLIPQLRREANSTEVISEEMASWISSIHGYASIPWFILPIASGRFGRKYPFIAVSIISLISFIVLYCSSTPKHILIAEVFQGALCNCQMSISTIIVAEYSSPKHRGLFLTLKSASLNWGILFANTLGTFFHWKTIAIAGIICSLYNLITSIFWCESPSWLASKYRYEECARVHGWIKGEDAESEEELAALIKSCKEYQEKQEIENQNGTNLLTRGFKTILEKTFYKTIFVCIAMVLLYSSSGKMVCSIYAIDVLKKITLVESTAYMSMLMLDGVTVTGMYIGSVLSRYCKRRTLMLTGSSGGIIFLLILALYLFLSKSKVLEENKYVSLGLLTLFFLFISIGPIILSSSIYGELVPLRYRTAGMFIISICSPVFLATTLKTGPLIFRTFELHGAFLFYGAISSCLILYLFKFLPETKDKTLQEIEECIIGKTIRNNSIETQPMYKVNISKKY